MKTNKPVSNKELVRTLLLVNTVFFVLIVLARVI